MDSGSSAPVCSLSAEVGPGRGAFPVYSHSFKVNNTHSAQLWLCGAESKTFPSQLPQPLGCRDGLKKLSNGRTWGFEPPPAPSQRGWGPQNSPCLAQTIFVLLSSPTPSLLAYKELL